MFSAVLMFFSLYLGIWRTGGGGGLFQGIGTQLAYAFFLPSAAPKSNLSKTVILIPLSLKITIQGM